MVKVVEESGVVLTYKHSLEGILAVFPFSLLNLAKVWIETLNLGL